MGNERDIKNKSIKEIFQGMNASIFSSVLAAFIAGLYLGISAMSARYNHNCSSAQEVVKYLLTNDPKAILACVILLGLAPLYIYGVKK